MGTKQAKRSPVWYDNPLNSNIRKFLDPKVIKTDQFASALNVSSEAVRQWCGGYSRPDIDKLPDIAYMLGVSIDYLLGNSEFPSSDIDKQGVHKITDLPIEVIDSLIALKKYKNTIHDNSEFDAYVDKQALVIVNEKDIEHRIDLLKELLEYQDKYYKENIADEVKTRMWGEFAFIGINKLLTESDGQMILQYIGRLFSPEPSLEAKELAFARVIHLLSKIRNLDEKESEIHE